jgi:hypothetical protein
MTANRVGYTIAVPAPSSAPAASHHPKL